MEYEMTAKDEIGPRKKKDKMVGVIAASTIILLLTCSVILTCDVHSIKQIVAAKLDHGSLATGDKLGSKLTDNKVAYSKNTDSSQLVKRSGLDLDKSMLMPHPYLQGYNILPMVYPNSSQVTHGADHHSRLEKKWLWWTAAIAWKVGETGIAMRSLVKDCQDWSKNEADSWGKFSCVYGAVSTTLTIAGAGWKSYEHGSGIWKKLTDHLDRRDGPGITKSEKLTLLLAYQLAIVNITGLPWSPVLDGEGSLILDSRIKAPVHFGYDFRGIPAHMSYNYEGGVNKTVLFNFRHHPPQTKSSRGKREEFNQQNFTQGGLEAGFSYNQQFDGGWLDTQRDYQQMDHEVMCNIPALDHNGLQFQIYDNAHKGTMAAGNVRACSDGAFDKESLLQYSLPVQPNKNCEIA